LNRTYKSATQQKLHRSTIAGWQSKKQLLYFLKTKTDLIKRFYQDKRFAKGSNYSASLNKLLKDYEVTEIYYGVGLPDLEIVKKKIKEQQGMIDFALCVTRNTAVEVNYQTASIF
jgi:hypothetical protein